MMFDRLATAISKTPLTLGLIVANTSIFLLVLISAGQVDGQSLRQFGAHNNALIWDGQLHRLLFSAFLHGGFLHLLFNMLLLYYLGRGLEGLLGRSLFFVTYSLALFASSAACLLFLEPSTDSVGSSGAVFGLVGFTAFLLVVDSGGKVIVPDKRARNIFLVMVVGNLFLGYLNEYINNYAHVGGLLAGLGVGVFFWSQVEGVRVPRTAGVVVMVMLVGAVVGGLWLGLHPKGTSRWDAHQAWEAFHHGRTKEASRRFERLLSNRRPDAATRRMRAALLRCLLLDKRHDRAVGVARDLSRNNPKLIFYRMKLAETLALAGRRREAGKELSEAVRTHGKKDAVRLARPHVLSALGRYEEAIRIYQRRLEKNPDDAQAHNGMAWLLVTAKDRTYLAPRRAQHHANRALALLDQARSWLAGGRMAATRSAFLDTLAASNFQAGNLLGAVRAQKEALALASAPSDLNRPEFIARLKRYRRALTRKMAKVRADGRSHPDGGPDASPPPDGAQDGSTGSAERATAGE